MAETHDLAIDHRDGDDAHDAARCGADIVSGAGRKRGGSGQKGEQQRKETGHGRHSSCPNFERKHRDAIRIAAWHLDGQTGKDIEMPHSRGLFADDGVAYIDAHNAAAGCLAARIERAAA